MSEAYLPLLFSALAFFLSVVSFFYFRAYLKRRTGQERILAELRDEVNTILRSIDETTDRDISLIEEREKNLKSLLGDIEKRLRVYIQETEKHREAEEAYAALAPRKAPDTVSVPSVTDRPRGGGNYLELGKNRYRPNKQEIPPPDTPPEKTEDGKTAFPLPRFRVKQEAAEEDTPRPLPIGEQVRELAEAGLSVPAIASRLGLSVAEVEFAAALLERREK